LQLRADTSFKRRSRVGKSYVKTVSGYPGIVPTFPLGLIDGGTQLSTHAGTNRDDMGFEPNAEVPDRYHARMCVREQPQDGSAVSGRQVVRGMIRPPVKLRAVLVALGIALVPSALRAEEAGTGHYIPGATSSFIDMLPDRDSSTLVYANAFTYYHGSATGSKDLEFGGLLTANAKATIYSDTSFFLYQSPWKLLGGQYGVALLVPYVWLEVEGDVLLTGRRKGLRVTRNDTANGFGDVELFPVMLGWKHGDLKWQTQLGIYAPTGDFNKGDLANIGRNYWTFEPTVALSYLSSTIGLEFTSFAGFTFNTMNDSTDYQTGHQFHLDGTLAEHLPLFGGFAGGGVNGFFYQQISGDSGSGARLGGFEGMTTGIGPVFSYAYQIGDFDLAAEVKWLPELDVTNRLNGDTVWFKLGVSWGPKPASPLESM